MAVIRALFSKNTEKKNFTPFKCLKRKTTNWFISDSEKTGHPTGMSMARRRNKVGGTDLMDADYGIMNMGDYSDGGEGK